MGNAGVVLEGRPGRFGGLRGTQNSWGISRGEEGVDRLALSRRVGGSVRAIIPRTSAGGGDRLSTPLAPEGVERPVIEPKSPSTSIGQSSGVPRESGGRAQRSAAAPRRTRSSASAGPRSTTSRTSTWRFPHDQLVVMTGLSGSGKSSLAFDTIFAEGQRKYMESLSAYARQFLDQLKKPDVERSRASPHHRDRTAVGVEQPAVDGGDDDGDLRLPAPAVRAVRDGVLVGPDEGEEGRDGAGAVGRAHHRDEQHPDRRRGDEARGGHEADRCWRRWCGPRRASTAT